MFQRPLSHVILPADRLDLGVLGIVDVWANEGLSVNPIVIEESDSILVSFFLAKIPICENDLQRHVAVEVSWVLSTLFMHDPVELV